MAADTEAGTGVANRARTAVTIAAAASALTFALIPVFFAVVLVGGVSVMLNAGAAQHAVDKKAAAPAGSVCNPGAGQPTATGTQATATASASAAAPASTPPATLATTPPSGGRGAAGQSTTVASGGVAAQYGLTAEQMQNASTIIQVGQQLTVPTYGQVIAIATALQESSLINSTVANDHDSLGLFQQRPSQGWGTPEQVTDPIYASNRFYKALLAVSGWQGMALTDAAQAVQHSGLPWAYAKWETEARAIVGQLANNPCPNLGTGSAQTVIQAAEHWIGTPYSWGGGDAHGPTVGKCTQDGDSPNCPAATTVGFDCSGLTLYAYAQINVILPHGAYDQYKMLQKIDRAHLQPGDLLYYATDLKNPATIHHVTIYLGGDQMVEAAKTGTNVRITSGIWTDDYYAPQFIAGGRP